MAAQGANGHVYYTYIDHGHDDMYEYMDDGTRGLSELKVPLKGGTALQRWYRRGNWVPLNQAPLRAEFD